MADTLRNAGARSDIVNKRGMRADGKGSSIWDENRMAKNADRNPLPHAEWESGWGGDGAARGGEL